MTLDKAIEELTTLKLPLKTKQDYDKHIAVRMGIEALNVVKESRERQGLWILPNSLPGETQGAEPQVEQDFKTFYLIDLKKKNGKFFWRWTRTKDEWEEVTDIQSFLTTYYPPDWRLFILETL